MRIFYGKGAYQRTNLPELRLVNLFLETTPTDESGAVLMSRKGLTQHSTAGAGPIRGVFRQDGVFNGDIFCVSGNTLYRSGVAVGTVSGAGPVSFAAGSASELAVNAGADIHRYDGVTLATVAFPDGASVRKIVFHDGLYLAARDDGHAWYWSSVLDADTWNALDFASAEAKPDRLLDFLVVNDMAYLFGSETIEKWANTGNADSPYQRQELSTLSKGIKATGCLVEMDQAIHFVSNENIAYSLRDGPERISDHGIEERIAASGSVSCFGFVRDGHSFVCIRLDNATLAFDLATRQWCELASWQRDNFRARCATPPGPSPVFGDDEEGILWEFGGWQDGDDPLERLWTFAMPLDGGTATIDNIQAWVNVGQTDDLSGQGADPQVEMRLSRDAGQTFGNWRSAPMGAQGEYRARTIWRRCGMFDPPGLLGEMRVTDPVGVRMSNIRVNEPGGGRSR